MLALKNTIIKEGMNWDSILNTLYIMCLDICVNEGEYDGLPEEIPNYIPEVINFGYGSGVFFNKGGKYFALPCVIGDRSLNIYGEPYVVDAIPIGGNGEIIDTLRVRDVGANFEVKPKNAVLMLNNIERMPTVVKILPLLNRLDYLWSTMGINEAMSRVGLLASCNKSQFTTMKDVLKNLMGKKDIVTLVRDKTQMENVMPLDFKVEYICDKYWYDFDKVFTLLCTFLGINCNFASQKKERLISDEVNANNELITYLKESRKRYRDMWVDDANKTFGLNIKWKPFKPEETKERVENDFSIKGKEEGED